MEEKNKKEIIYIPLDEIIPNRFQPRLAFDEKELNDLANSIIKYGIIQPIVVRQVGEKYEIIAGERRYKAATMAGIKKIPAILNNTDDNTSAEIALLENLQRKNLTVIEEAKSFKKLMDRGFKQETIASKLGISQSSIANKIRLLSLPKSVQNSLLYNKISERHARCLLTLDNEEDQRNLLNRIINEKLTVKQTEDEINKMLNKYKEPAENYLDPSNFKATVTLENMPPLEYFDPNNYNTKVGAVTAEEIKQANNTEETKRLLDNIVNKVNNDDDDEYQEIKLVPNVEVVEQDFSKDYNNINPFQENKELLDRILNKRFEEEKNIEPSVEAKPFNKLNNTVDKIRNCIKDLGVKKESISTTEIDLDKKYRIIIEIDKDAL